MQVLLCASLGSPAAADMISCSLSGVSVHFEIDFTQFAPPQDTNEPPRRKVTTVHMGNAQFPAEAIVMGEVRGFWAEGLAGSNVMLIIQSDGTAIYTNAHSGERLTGACQVQQ